MASSSALQRLSNLSNQLQPRSSNTASGELVVKVSSEVSDALSSGRPVVALESTVISHGMPYPQNFETAKEVEAIVRQNGAVPATIAILDGLPHGMVFSEFDMMVLSFYHMAIHLTNEDNTRYVVGRKLDCIYVNIGLNLGEMEKLAALGRKVRKTSLRDIPYVVSTNGNGATTVSATMFFASKVGVSVFATGGIGGVHRGNTMDVSTDLTALGTIPVAVFSAGVKSILDIPRTLEYLETMGVCVAAYGTDEFPAFFTEKSGCKAHCQVDSPEECAQLIDAKVKLNLEKGILFAVPIPEKHAASGNLIESAIQTAIREAREKKITGSAETPYVLARVSELTGGASLASNIALIKNNAAVAAQTAVALARLRLITH